LSTASDFSTQVTGQNSRPRLRPVSGPNESVAYTKNA
jgi:hypothetical protein